MHAKNLLWVRGVKPQHLVKIPAKDALWVAKNIEPRVLEVLPAALLHFPKAFLFKDQLPKEFLEIISDIQKGKPEGNDYNGIAYKDMLRWANIQLKDQRTKKQEDKKTNMTLRLTEKHKTKFKNIAKRKNTTPTKLFEDWIESHLD
ncbi:MAG: hypothetical protein R2877_08005 [Bdellovibrionota bacterium]